MEPSPFLRLPAELRNEIYECIFCWQEWQVVGSPYEAAVAEACLATQPGITRTCKQIRQETLELYYARNHFCIQLPEADRTEFAISRQIGNAGVHQNVYKRAMVAIRKWVSQTPKAYHVLMKELRIAGYYNSDSESYTRCCVAECKLLKQMLQEHEIGFYGML
ncbi:hypothetical protein LTR86_003700 [Recurvomyces mirabilis]|nr:hypothetical protein LTR86_003700 [Recurvomyces mirabilis]